MDADGEADQDRGQGRPRRQGCDVPTGGGSGAPGVVRGDPGADRSTARGAEPRVIVHRGRKRLAWSQGGRGWSAVSRGSLAEKRVERGRRGVRPGIRLCRPLQSRRFFLDKGMRPVSNACSGEPGEVPDDEVNAHLGNLGSSRGNKTAIELFSAGIRGWEAGLRQCLNDGTISAQ